MTKSDAVTRIHTAIGRIEAAIERRGRDEDAMRRRHAALRREVTQAIAGIDALVAAPDAQPESAPETMRETMPEPLPHDAEGQR